MFGLRWAPYAWQGLMNRYASEEVLLQISAEGTGALRNALGEGPSESAVIIRYRDCPPRTLIRVYWPLEAAGAERR